MQWSAKRALEFGLCSICSKDLDVCSHSLALAHKKVHAHMLEFSFELNSGLIFSKMPRRSVYTTCEIKKKEISASEEFSEFSLLATSIF